MDSALPPDPRRRFFALATGTVGGIGLAATTIMFAESMQPSERARAAGGPVEVDLACIAPGNLLTIEWRGRPVWVLQAPSRCSAKDGIFQKWNLPLQTGRTCAANA